MPKIARKMATWIDRRAGLRLASTGAYLFLLPHSSMQRVRRNLSFPGLLESIEAKLQFSRCNTHIPGMKQPLHSTAAW